MTLICKRKIKRKYLNYQRIKVGQIIIKKNSSTDICFIKIVFAILIYFLGVQNCQYLVWGAGFDQQTPVVIPAGIPANKVNFGLELESLNDVQRELIRYLDWKKYFKLHPEFLKKWQDIFKDYDSQKETIISHKGERYFKEYRKIISDIIQLIEEGGPKTINHLQEYETLANAIRMNIVNFDFSSISLREDAHPVAVNFFKLFDRHQDGSTLELILKIPKRDPNQVVGLVDEAVFVYNSPHVQSFTGWDQPFGAHLHVNIEGRSLRREVAALNFLAAINYIERGQTNINNHVSSYNSVDNKGIYRLYDADRIEIRGPGAVYPRRDLQRVLNFLGNPAQHLLESKDKIQNNFYKLLMDLLKAPPDHKSLNAFFESLASVSQLAPNFLGENLKIQKILNLALKNNNTKVQELAMLIVFHINGLPEELIEQAHAIFEQSVNKNPLNVSQIKKFMRVQDDKIKKRVMEDLTFLNEDQLFHVLGKVDELCFDEIIDLAVRALENNINNLSGSASSLLRLPYRLPKNKKVRGLMVRGLRSKKVEIQIKAAAALARIPHFLKQKEADLVLKVAMENWESPLAKELRKIILNNTRAEWATAILNRLIRTNSIEREAMLLALKGPIRDQLIKEILKVKKENPQWLENNNQCYLNHIIFEAQINLENLL